MLIIIIIIISAFNGVVRDFFTISSLRRKLSPTRTLKWARHNRVKIMCNTSSAYHVQHVVCHCCPAMACACTWRKQGVCTYMIVSVDSCACTCACIQSCTWVCTLTHNHLIDAQACEHVLTFMHVHPHRHAYIYVNMYTHAHTHTYRRNLCYAF